MLHSSTSRRLTLLKRSAAALALCLGASWAAADTVTLRTENNGTSISGELVSFDGMKYVLRTSLGDLTFDAAQAVCEGAACPSNAAENGELMIAGSGSLTAGLLPSIVKAYASSIEAKVNMIERTGQHGEYLLRKPNGHMLRLGLDHSNSKAGVQALTKETADLAISTRSATEAEQRIAENAGLGTLRSEAQEHVMAYDGLLIVTNPVNPIRAVSETNVAQIFAGDIDNWAQLGGPEGEIEIYMRDDNSSSRDLLTEVLMDPHRETLTANVSVFETDAQIAAAVRDNPNAIGLTSFVHRAGVNALEIEGVCGIRVPATHFTIKTGEYPLSRPVLFYRTNGDYGAPAEEFVNFMQSDEAQYAVRQAGFVDRQITSEPLNTQGLRVTHAIMRDDTQAHIEGTKSMLKLMSSARRLSTTIRFANGSTDLTPRDYAEMERLAQLIRSDEYNGTVFYFMGFSDSIGRADLNQFLALQRAEIVRQALVSRHPDLADRIKARSVGYGELSPLACNETRPGRKVNRRVEVWVHNPAAVARN